MGYMEAITNVMGTGEPDFQGLTANITKLDTAVKEKLSKIRGELETVKTKAETANTSLTAKLKKLEGESQAKIVKLESDIKNLNTKSESEKKKVNEQINSLKNTVTKMSDELGNNNESNTLITSLNGVIESI